LGCGDLDTRRAHQMITLNFSEEDYQALLGTLADAASDARGMEWEGDDNGAGRAEEANRLFELIKPIDYKES
ncbi:MAG: hypothetical protein KGL39_46745, partial [Patescibacteria group bacterium]|nr:hypothetical protein [Patescibacteria group bacterium]